MRIAEVNTYYAPYVAGGAEVVLEHLTEFLRGEGNTVRVFTLGPRQSALETEATVRRPHRNLYWPPDAPAPPLWKRAVWHARNSYSPGTANQLARDLRDFRPDVVHFHGMNGFSSAAYGAVRRALPRVPMVHTLHDYWLACVRKTLLDGRGEVCAPRHGLCRVRGRWIRRHAERVTAFVSPSQFLADYHVREELIPFERLHVIPNGVPMPPSVAAVRSRRQRAPGEPVNVLYLGQLVAHKGIRLLLEAAADVSHAQVTVRVAGTGPLAQAVRNCAAVEYLGRVDGSRKVEAMLDADVLVIPSTWYENNPLVALEAMQAGLALVGADIGGIPELVTGLGTGVVFPAGDRRALARCLASLVPRRQDVHQWQLAALEHAAAYTTAAMGRRYTALFTSLAGAEESMRLASGT